MVDADSLYEEVLDLSEEKRAELALRILWSLEAPDPNAHLTDEEFVEELERRVREIDAGRAKSAPWEQVRDELRSKIKR